METEQDRPAIEAELTRISVALQEKERPECYRELYAAQQALSWVLNTEVARSPFNTIMGIPADLVNCQENLRQPQS